MLSGWFGGTGAQDDQAWLDAQFLDGAGAVLGVAEVGRVSAVERGDVTGLWERRVYQLERSSDLLRWDAITPQIPGVGGPLQFEDSDAPADRAYYRLTVANPGG